MVMRIYLYELATKTISKIEDLAYTSQYPLSVVSLSENKIYYSADVSDKGDQLFAYHIETKRTEQCADDTQWPLTTTQTRIHGRYPLIRRPTKRTSLNSPSLISEKKRNKEIDVSTRSQRKIIELEKENVLQLSARGNQILLVTSPEVVGGPVEFSLVNIDTGERQKLDLKLIARSDAFLDKDMAGIYVLGGPVDSDLRGIYYYNLITKKTDPIFLQTNGFINNFMLLRY